MAAIEAVIFDFDGVVIMSEPVHCQAWVDLAAELNRTLPHGFLEKGIGSSDQELATELAHYWENHLDEPTVLQRKRHYYQHRIATDVVLVQGALELIEHLHGKYKLGVATSSSITDITPVFARYQLHRFFDSVLTIEDVTQAKPHPEIYLKSATKLGVDPKSCLVFEDSIHGVTAARAAGMNLVAVTTSFKDHELAPWTLTVPHYGDRQPILDLLRR